MATACHSLRAAAALSMLLYLGAKAGALLITILSRIVLVDVGCKRCQYAANIIRCC